MRHRFALPLLAATALTLTSCTGVSVNENSKPAEQKGAFFSTKSTIETTGDKGFKEEKRVAVPSFRVGFVQALGAKAHASGGLGSSGYANVKANTTLHGLDNDVYQALTDAAYANFIADLKAKGYEVVDKKEFEGLASYQNMSTVSSPQKLEVGGGDILYFAPTGMKLIVMPGEEGGLSGLKGLDSNGPLKALPAIGKELKAGVMEASFVVDYVNAGGSGGFFARSASVEVGPGLSIRPGSGVTFWGYNASQCVGYCPDVYSSAKLGQAVYSQEKFGELKDMQTDAEKAGQMALRAVTALAGSSYGWATYEMHAKPEDYKRITSGLLEQSNEKLTDTMAKLR